MRICVLGTGYVGLVSGTGLAHLGHDVACVDVNADRIAMLDGGEVPIFEPGLAEMVAKSVEAGRLHFTTNGDDAIAQAELVMIAVGTPGGPDGRADLRALRAAAHQIAAAATRDLVVIIKSTVPVGTGDQIEKLMRADNPDMKFDLVSNPEFLREGSAIEDFMRPDRIVFGRENADLDPVLTALYSGLPDAPLVLTGRRSAELIKYAANSYLAMKVTFINEMADIAEQVGADVADISRGIGLDPRIGPSFLRAGPGFGGSCFPKDMLALIRTARDVERPSRLIEATVEVNNHRISNMANRVVSVLGGDAVGKRVALLGITFKPDTDDVRVSPAVAIAEALLAAEAEVAIYDPQGMDNAKALLPEARFCTSACEAAENSDVLVIATEWEEFAQLDLSAMGAAMKSRKIVDFRNIFAGRDLRAEGFDYFPIGRG